MNRSKLAKSVVNGSSSSQSYCWSRFSTSFDGEGDSKSEAEVDLDRLQPTLVEKKTLKAKQKWSEENSKVQ